MKVGYQCNLYFFIFVFVFARNIADFFGYSSFPRASDNYIYFTELTILIKPLFADILGTISLIAILVAISWIGTKCGKMCPLWPTNTYSVHVMHIYLFVYINISILSVIYMVSLLNKGRQFTVWYLYIQNSTKDT